MTIGVTSLTGYTAANINGSAGAFARCMLVTASTTESIGSLEFYFDSTYDGDAIVKLFIANSSGTILGITGVVTAPASGGTAWCGGSITPVAVTSGQDYYLGMYIAANSCNGSGRAGVYRAGGSPTNSYIDSTSGTYSAPPSVLSALSNDGSYSSIGLRGVTAAVVSPSISSISANPANLGSVDLYGTNFPTSQSGSAGITIGGVAQTVTWNTSTSCSISSIDIGTNKFGTSVDIIATDASGNASTGYATTFSPRSGGASVDLSGTMASSGVRLVASPDIAAGDQIEYYGATGGTIPTDVTVNNDGTYDTADAVTGFYWRVWTTGGGWGTAAFETVTHAAESSGDTGALFKTMMGSLFKTLLEAS